MKKVILGLATVALIAAGCSNSVSTTPTPSNVQNPSASQPTSSQKTYTMSEVSAADSAEKCWTVISGKVYDVTSFITKHPGGAAKILSLCGKDGTAAFSGQHGGQARPESSLAGLQIGLLK